MKQLSAPKYFLFKKKELLFDVSIPVPNFDTLWKNCILFTCVNFETSWNFQVALCLYKSTIKSCMKYCCHVWAGALSCYFDVLDKLQKLVCRTVGPTLAASLEPLAHCRTIASSLVTALIYRYLTLFFPWRKS